MNFSKFLTLMLIHLKLTKQKRYGWLVATSPLWAPFVGWMLLAIILLALGG